jgi:lambda family phage portal protein
MARISQIDPKTGALSFTEQAQSSVKDSTIQNSFFDGAKVNRFTQDWVTRNATYDSLLESDLKKLRARSASLISNDGYSKNAQDLTVANMLGDNGFKIRVYAKNLRGGEDKKASQVVEEAWRKFCRSTDYSVTGDMTEHEFDAMLIRSLFETGDALQRIVRGFSGNKSRFAFQGIPTAHLDPEFHDRQRGIVMSVQKDNFDKPIAYYLTKSNPGDEIGYASAGAYADRLKVESKDLIHAFISNEFGSTQGQPWLTPAISRLRQLHGYEEASLISARMEASKIGFLTQDYESGGYDGEGTDSMGNITMDASAGSFEVLPAGVEPKLIDPSNPNGNYLSFRKGILQGVAAALPVTYHGLAEDLEGVSYSSIRSGTLAEREQWKGLQRWFADKVKRPGFLAWLEWWLISGQSPFKISDFDRLTDRVDFTGRRWQWVDPVKDAQAEKMKLEMRLASHPEVLREQGKDFETVLSESAEAEKLAQQLDLPLFPDQVPPAEPATEED